MLESNLEFVKLNLPLIVCIKKSLLNFLLDSLQIERGSLKSNMRSFNDTNVRFVEFQSNITYRSKKTIQTR